MPPWVTDAVLVALITGTMGLIGGRLSSRGQAEADRVAGVLRERELMTAPYEALAARVSQLEEKEAEQRETIDSQQAEISELRAEMKGLRAARADELRGWMARDARWQAAWDELRGCWAECRADELPPPYPVDRLNHNDTSGGGVS